MTDTFAYKIELKVLPNNIETTKPWRKRIRKIVRHLVEEEWKMEDAFSSGKEDELKEKWDALTKNRVEACQAWGSQFVDLVGTPTELHSAELQLDTETKTITVQWTTKTAQDVKHKMQEESLRSKKKILKMMREKNRPPEWDRYLQLKPHWPSNADSMLPLPDPDTVRKQKDLYIMWLSQFAEQYQRASKQSMIRVMYDYVSMCIPDK